MKEILQTSVLNFISIVVCLIHACASLHVETVAKDPRPTEAEEAEAGDQFQDPEQEYEFEVEKQEQEPDLTNFNTQGKHRKH